MKKELDLGFKNEHVIKDYLCGKRFKELNKKWKKHIKVMFPKIKRDDLINASLYPDRRAKPDIIIKVNNRSVNMSIKTGHCPSMHNEGFDSFLNYLRRIGVSQRSLSVIYFYHYGMNKKISNNGIPYTREEILTKFSEVIKYANNELNKDYIIREVVNRCVIMGTENRSGIVDYFYYGVIDKGFLLNKEDVYKLIIKDKSDKDRGIHFGGLIYQPGARDITSKRINTIKIKWPILSIEYYKRRY